MRCGLAGARGSLHLRGTVDAMSLVVEHGASRGAQWLRERRVKIALVIAAIEGALVVFDVIPWWVALVVAGAVLAFYVWFGRTASWAALRQTSWIAAASQVMVALVPVLVFVIGTLALIAIAILAVVALVLLFRDRR